MALKDVSPWLDEAQSLVAWGGGVEMPGVSQMLSTKAITAVEEHQRLQDSIHSASNAMRSARQYAELEGGISDE
jgi:hypothetical protein